VEQQHLHLRQVAPLLEMDTAQLSNIEKGSDELMTLWLVDQICGVVKDEELIDKAMQLAKKNTNLKNKKVSDNKFRHKCIRQPSGLEPD
jgi:HTH-type transcriptional regulator, competence development regulator